MGNGFFFFLECNINITSFVSIIFPTSAMVEIGLIPMWIGISDIS